MQHKEQIAQTKNRIKQANKKLTSSLRSIAYQFEEDNQGEEKGDHQIDRSQENIDKEREDQIEIAHPQRRSRLR